MATEKLSLFRQEILALLNFEQCLLFYNLKG